MKTKHKTLKPDRLSYRSLWTFGLGLALSFGSAAYEATAEPIQADTDHD